MNEMVGAGGDRDREANEDMVMARGTPEWDEVQTTTECGVSRIRERNRSVRDPEGDEGEVDGGFGGEGWKCLRETGVVWKGRSSVRGEVGLLVKMVGNIYMYIYMENGRMVKHTWGCNSSKLP